MDITVHPMLGSVTTAVLLLVSVGIAAAASLFMRRKSTSDSSPIREDDQPTTLTSRGVYIPMIFGTRRVGYAFGWAGDRKTKTVSTGGGGGGKGGGGDDGGGSTQTFYYESGCHWIGVGPAHTLHAVFANGKQIWTGPVTKDSTPSGTSINVPNYGTMTIYWGDRNQPSNGWLSHPSRTNIRSRWPCVAYIVWQDFKCGTGGYQWPQIEYEISFGIQENLVPSSSYSIQPVNGEGYPITNGGLNAAHVLAQVMGAPFPHGVGLTAQSSKSRLDETSLTEVGILMETEAIGINIIADKGKKAADLVQTLLQDLGLVLTEIDGRLCPRPIRHVDPTTKMVLGEDVLPSVFPERVFDHNPLGESRRVYTFKNEDGNYRDHDIKTDHDGLSSQQGAVQTSTLKIESTTSLSASTKIARRREQESRVKGGIKFRALRGAATLVAGDPVLLDGMGHARITSKKWFDDSPEVELEALADCYSLVEIEDSGEPGGTPMEPLDPAADLYVTWFELPSSLTDRILIVILRARAHAEITGSSVHVSPDGTNYHLAGEQPAAAQVAILQEAISDSTGELIETGPIVEPVNSDFSDILDLSGDSISWTQGQQIAVINDEVFYIESATLQTPSLREDSTAYVEGDEVIFSGVDLPLRYVCTTAGTSASSEPEASEEIGTTFSDGDVVWEVHYREWQLNNLIRAQHGTVKAAHAIDDVVYITPSSALVPIEHTCMMPGIDLRVKTQPRTLQGVVDLSTVTPVTKTLRGKALGDITYRVTSDGKYRTRELNTLRIVE